MLERVELAIGLAKELQIECSFAAADVLEGRSAAEIVRTIIALMSYYGRQSTPGSDRSSNRLVIIPLIISADHHHDEQPGAAQTPAQSARSRGVIARVFDFFTAPRSDGYQPLDTSVNPPSEEPRENTERSRTWYEDFTSTQHDDGKAPLPVQCVEHDG